MRNVQTLIVVDHPELAQLGIDHEMLRGAIAYTYSVLDSLDATLIGAGELRLARLLELANLSAIVGNLYRAGLAKSSRGRFKANGPHKYPDLVSTESAFEDVEIKVALEDNKPKGHLVKPGPHITVRYVLGNEQGVCMRGKLNRGTVLWIWEVRVGRLTDDHFNVSNTEGDSGKTAVVNKHGMTALKLAFVDLERCPISPAGSRFAALAALRSQD